MNPKTLLSALPAAALALLALALPFEVGAAASPEQSPVASLPSFSPVAGAESTLVRLDTGVSFDIHTSQLTPSAPVTLLLVIFNNPTACNHGPVPGVRCGEGDLGVPAVNGSVVVAATRTPGSDGRLGDGGSLSVGDVQHALNGGPGLTNPSGADIHLVLVLQDGTKVQASVHEAPPSAYGSSRP